MHPEFARQPTKLEIRATLRTITPEGDEWLESFSSVVRAWVRCSGGPQARARHVLKSRGFKPKFVPWEDSFELPEVEFRELRGTFMGEEV